MKIRYKITLAFIVLTATVLVALCVLIYYINAEQQRRDFNQRLRNRALTVGTLLSKLPSNGYQILSQLDSATTNLLVSENIMVYGVDNTLLYQFNKEADDKIELTADFLADARSQGSATDNIRNKQVVALFYPKAAVPILVVTAARDENGNANLTDLKESLLIAFFTGLVLAFLTGLLFSARLLKPIENIANSVNSISAGNIEDRLPESRINDEWNRLSVTFNRLLGRLQESFELQGRFISNASHELSTPLTVVNNQIEVTLQKPRSNEEYVQIMQSVRAEVQHMTDLTQQLLTLARTARGGYLQTDPVRIDEILMELPSLLKKISPENTALVYFDELPDDEKLSTVEGNYDLLFSAFRNIAENACKYAPDHTVQISLSFVAEKIVVLFANACQYFNPAEVEAIFQPFQRGSNVSAEPGFGLGLSLTRRIILLHKGEIKAEIAKPGNVLFSVVLPSSFKG